MGDRSGIEWIRGNDGSAGATWNPIIATDRVTNRRGSFCIHKSEGCRGCWASAMNVFRGTGLEYIAQNLDRHRFEIINDPKSQRSIDWPLRKKTPRKIFPCSMTDLFAAWHTDEMIDRVFATMALAHWHTFILTTKEAARMCQYLNQPDRKLSIVDQICSHVMSNRALRARMNAARQVPASFVNNWPLPNVWCGISAEDQKNADARIPFLLQSPAAVRWVSAEPLLGPITLAHYYKEEGQGTYSTWLDYLNWVVVGGESGPTARFMAPEWPRSLRNECLAYQVAFFFKQWGVFLPSGQDDAQGRNQCSDINYARVGKKAAGRSLDGREWNEYPEAAAA